MASAEVDEKVSSMKHRISAASVGGIITAMIMTPLDVVKIRMQDCSVRVQGYTGPDAEQAVSESTKKEGKNYESKLTMALPQTVIYFTVNDWLKDWVGYSNSRVAGTAEVNAHKTFGLNDCTPALVGGASRVVAVGAISPLELLRTKMQAIQRKRGDVSRTILNSVKQDGIRSLWVGMGPTLLRDVPYSMVFWLVFEYLKSDYIVQQFGHSDLFSKESIIVKDLTFCRAFAYGAVAGLMAGILTHPFDVIKTRRQIELGEAIIAGHSTSKSTWASLYRLYSSNGIQALFAGFTPRLVKTTHASAIMLATFESFKGYFVNSFERT